MINEQLRIEMLEKLGLSGASKEEQDSALFKVESIAHKRLAMTIPELLTQDQLDEFEARQSRGESDESVMEWVASLLPQYEEMMNALLLDIADEIAANSEAVGE